jgi:hypothetical protein
MLDYGEAARYDATRGGGTGVVTVRMLGPGLPVAGADS